LSAILEALRRVEREAPALGPQSIPPRVDPRKTFRLKIRRDWFARRAVTLALSFFVLASSGWVLSKFLAGINRTPVSEVNASAETGDRTRASRVALDRPVPVDDRFPAEMRRWGKTAKWVPKAAEPEKQRSRRFPSGVQEISPVSPDETFKLEALVWSTNPESRFAVISGQIVKVGQSIRGASVTEIERDHVALKSGDQTLELRIQALQ
jgi:type II secretory pathway component PulC